MLTGGIVGVTSPSKRKGARFERAVVEYFRAHGFPHAERAYGAGRPDDRGDIDGLIGFTIECKATEAVRLAEQVDEACVEALNADAAAPGSRHLPVLVKKRRGARTADSFVTMPLWAWTEVVLASIEV